jgi:hypothetical protein
MMTDSRSAYGSAVFTIVCRGLGIKRYRTQPYRPRTNGRPRG